MLGDCLERMKEIPDGSIDMVLCDLPYGTTRCKWDTPIVLERLWPEYHRVCKDNAAIVLFAQTPFDKVLGSSNLKELRYEWIWQKTSPTGHLNANKMPLKSHENILVFYRKLPKYYPQKTYGHSPVHAFTKTIEVQNRSELYGYTRKEIKGGGSTERFPISILRFSSDKQKSHLHPTQKPVALLEYLIKTYTNEGDTVLDNCMGSGSTGVACLNTGRSFLGIESDKKYFDVAEKRILFDNHLFYKEAVNETYS